MVTGVTGIVLAGGESSRMGRPKAQLIFGRCALIDIVVSRLREVMDQVIVVAAPGQHLAPAGARVVHDAVAHQGPMNGMRHGLAAARSNVCFVTSCDLAFLNRSLIAHLVEVSPGHDVVVPRWHERLQPLHAVYRRAVLPLLEGLLAAGERRPVSLFARVRTLTVEEDEIRRFDPDGWSLFNINTPADYSQAVERWRLGPPAG